MAKGVAEFGRIDFVLANAGILPAAGEPGSRVDAFVDAVNVMLNGVYFTIEAALPAMLAHGDGGAIVITSSAAGFKPVTVDFGTASHGAAGYTAAKHGVIGVMRHFARALAEKNIRVNSVHPGGVATPMIYNDAMADVVGGAPVLQPVAAATVGRPAGGAGGHQRHDGVPVWPDGPVCDRGGITGRQRADSQVILP